MLSSCLRPRPSSLLILSAASLWRRCVGGDGQGFGARQAAAHRQQQGCRRELHRGDLLLSNSEPSSSQVLIAGRQREDPRHHRVVLLDVAWIRRAHIEAPHAGVRAADPRVSRQSCYMSSRPHLHLFDLSCDSVCVDLQVHNAPTQRRTSRFSESLRTRSMRFSGRNCSRNTESDHGRSVSLDALVV